MGIFRDGALSCVHRHGIFGRVYHDRGIADSTANAWNTVCRACACCVTVYRNDAYRIVYSHGYF